MWQRERSLWRPDRACFYSCPVPGVIASTSRPVVSFTPSTPAEDEFPAQATQWDFTVNFTGKDYLTVAFGTEQRAPVPMIDPAGANIALDLSRESLLSGSNVWLYYKALAGLGLTGTLTVRIVWIGGTAAGNVVRRTYVGAAQAAPTPAGINSIASANSLQISFASPNAAGSLEFVAQHNQTAVTPTLTGGLTESGRTVVDVTQSFGMLMGVKDGSLTAPQLAGITYTGTANRMVCCAHVVNPA